MHLKVYRVQLDDKVDEEGTNQDTTDDEQTTEQPDDSTTDNEDKLKRK